MSHVGLSGLIGNSMSGGLGQSMSGAVGSPYQQHMNPAQVYNAMMAQQQSQHLYQASAKPEWMIAGKAVSITEFADELFGDTPQRTMFLLKYSDKGK